MAMPGLSTRARAPARETRLQVLAALQHMDKELVWPCAWERRVQGGAKVMSLIGCFNG